MAGSKPRRGGGEASGNKKSQGTGPNTRSRRVDTQHAMKSAATAIAIVALAASSSYVSQLTLSPVYGSVPASSFHRQGVMIAALVGWLGMNQIKALCFGRPASLLPVLAWVIPTIQYFLFQQSSRLGPEFGPLITELSTLYPLVALSATSAGMFLRELDLSRGPRLIADHGTFLGSYILFTTTLRMTGSYLARHIGSSVLMTRTGLQFAIATLFSICLPSKWLLLTIPSLIFYAGFNIHVPSGLATVRLNTSLRADDYVLLHRQDSLTGYISVLENKKLNFRVMRCDHSLLGGEWIPPPGMPKQLVSDPVYAVFTMLESVRLIKTDKGEARRAGSGTNALVIGLGIGTTPAALVAHGINTTVVEIDPTVHQLATEYFKFPSKANTVIEDAVTFVQRTRNLDPIPRYDFIVHDVFTGGVEPADLFTLDFMHGLLDLLQDDGVIAINYAGDLTLPSAGLIVRTILAAFPSCRVFREGQPTAGPAGDFTNMVIFCTKTESALEFREPITSDYLGSMSRESYMFPKFEIEKDTFKNAGSGHPDILDKNQIGQLQKWHSQSAIGHWKIMRTVLPAAVWEKW
ncbi:spermine/spermidine synthase [Coccidioides immitis RS]|uniref:Spermine/spermidine synthase n=3 Tax=Coccidioides immitis TaxID=5501 RepID=J3K8X2_COCIM|nr:spermine/spermidine synthase [Coccidioides immitis RS]EAS31307.3 spermine/spermidine synthase [Coccidioides immitis RS]KMP03942.1 spermine/spermidine synthase family protein [Coccidioides immitis RMSCC 2394]KMU74918.1 spermine/spermidine synthase family protein [Coccidioides immitis RMSCC 3703]TPX24131.1 hypothetical protein DIZ76_013474 [Coccidioides immitis]